MKKVVVSAIVLLGLSVEASWSQEYCSNGEGTVRVASGDDKKVLELTLRGVNRNGEERNEIISLAPEEYRIKVEHHQEIFATSSVACEVGDESALSSWRRVEYRQVKIFREDEKSFDEDIVGISRDRDYVSTVLICEETGHDRVACGDTTAKRPSAH